MYGYMSASFLKALYPEVTFVKKQQIILLNPCCYFWASFQDYINLWMTTCGTNRSQEIHKVPISWILFSLLT